MKERINKILHALNDNLYEREEVIQLTLLTTIAGESVFLLGLPGVAKSLIARRIKTIFKDGNSFEYLMNRFSTPDEIFGPIAISKLKNEDKYERKVEKYLPTADIVFLDEIWKAGPSIQNALLTVINEKIYRNGEQEINVPLKGLIAASNELPAKGEGLEALWDRFVVRYLVENISNPENFNDFISLPKIPVDAFVEEDLKVTKSEYHEWQEAISEIKISEEALNVINVIRNYIDKYSSKKDCETPIYVSDRRWRKIVKLLKTSAFLNNRTAIDLMDCFLIAHTIWNEVEQIEIVKEFVTDAIKKHGYSLKYDLAMFTKEIEDLKLDIDNQTKKSKKITYYVPKEVTIKKEVFYEIDKKSLADHNNLIHYRFIKKKEFEILLKTKMKFIDLHDKEFYDERRVEALSKEPNTIEIQYQYNWNSKKDTFNLIADRKNKTEVKTTRPHKAIIKDWDEKVQSIVKEIDTTIKAIEAFKSTDLSSLKENLFVNKSLASLAEYNLDYTIKCFVMEKVKVKKLKKYYDGL